MRLLIDRRGEQGEDSLDAGTVLSQTQIAQAYQTPAIWLRANMVSTINGSATGKDNLSGSINTEADRAIFAVLRAWCDVILVGAGTARAEGYRPTRTPLVVVSRRGLVPESLAQADGAAVILATCETAEGLDQARAQLGEDQVWVVGHDDVDLVALVERLHARGWGRVLTEGGPHLLGSLLAAGLVDEVAQTTAPLIYAPVTRGIVASGDRELERAASLLWLGEWEGSLFARWVFDR